jgi:hypothetical protein
MEMETTDGTVKRLGPGDLVLLEDTSGKGHVTRNPVFIPKNNKLSGQTLCRDPDSGKDCAC